jgi:hypothetical protein
MHDTIMHDTILQIIDYAIWAPSGDNSQPWTFQISQDDNLSVYLERDKDNPILNFRHSGTYVAHGALIENVIIAASHFGLKALPEILPEGESSDLVSRFSFQKLVRGFDGKPVQSIEDPLFPYLKERCCDRKKYKNIPLTSTEERELKGVGLSVAGSRTIFVEDKKKIAAIAKTSSLTERIALETPALHRLFFQSLIWSRREEQEKGIGLYVPTMELPGIARLMFKVLKFWPVTAFFNIFGFSRLASKGNSQIYASAAAYGLIIIPTHTAAGFVAAGRSMQRTWLTVAKLGLAFQPVTGIIFFTERVRANDAPDFLPKHIPLIKKADIALRSLYGLEGDQSVMAMQFRIGRADKPTARSLRVPAKVS